MKKKKTLGTDVYRAVENAYSCTYHFLRPFTNGKTYTTLEIQIHAKNYTGQLISWEKYQHVEACVDCFISIKESESLQLMIHEVLTSEIKSNSLPGWLLLYQDTCLKASGVFEVHSSNHSNNLEKKELFTIKINKYFSPEYGTKKQ